MNGFLHAGESWNPHCWASGEDCPLGLSASISNDSRVTSSATGDVLMFFGEFFSAMYGQFAGLTRMTSSSTNGGGLVVDCSFNFMSDRRLGAVSSEQVDLLVLLVSGRRNCCKML